MGNLDFMTNNKSFTISISGKGFTSPKEYYLSGMLSISQIHRNKNEMNSK